MVDHPSDAEANKRPRAVALLLVALSVGCSLDSPSDAGGEKSVLRSTLERAGAAQERYAELHSDNHARSIAQLEEVGLQVPAGIDLRVAAVNNSRSHFAREYCIEGRDADGAVAHFDNISKFDDGRCGSFWFESDDP